MYENTVLLTVSEVARLLRVSNHTVYYWVSRSEIPHLKVGKHLRFHRDAVLTFFETQTMRGANSGACRPGHGLVASTPKLWSLKSDANLADSSKKGIGNGNR